MFKVNFVVILTGFYLVLMGFKPPKHSLRHKEPKKHLLHKYKLLENNKFSLWIMCWYKCCHLFLSSRVLPYAKMNCRLWRQARCTGNRIPITPSPGNRFAQRKLQVQHGGTYRFWYQTHVVMTCSCPSSCYQAMTSTERVPCLRALFKRLGKLTVHQIVFLIFKVCQ